MTFLSSLFGGNTTQADTITILDKAAFKEAIISDVQLVDVRTPQEYQVGYINNATNIEFFNKADAEKYMDEGKFGEGNMAPKIKAALKFVENGGGKSVITEATKLEDRSYGTKITLEYGD